MTTTKSKRMTWVFGGTTPTRAYDCETLEDVCPFCNQAALVALPPELLAKQLLDGTNTVCHPSLGGCNQGYALEGVEAPRGRVIGEAVLGPFGTRMSRAKELRDELRGMLKAASVAQVLEELARVLEWDRGAVSDGALAERSAIVRWLRSVAQLIEGGEHLK